MRRISEVENGGKIRKRPGTAGKVAALILAVVIAAAGMPALQDADVMAAYAGDLQNCLTYLVPF